MPTRVIAFVPFKCFTRAKGRLRAALSDEAVEEVGRAMLADVLGALAGSRAVRRVVLTDDVAVAVAAQDCGAEVALRSPDPGLNAALAAASEEATASGYDASLIVLGDLPMLEPQHIDTVIAYGEDFPVVIAPALDGGTALLYRSPPRCIPELFGPDSAARHREAAERAGLPLRELWDLEPAARADLDTLEDAERVLRSSHPSRTREVLQKLLR